MPDQLEPAGPTRDAQPDQAAPPRARAEIARANGAQSRGPATVRGKAIACRNALRHGLAAREILLPGESRMAYGRHLAHFIREFQPQTPVEVELVATMANARWRLRRLASLETAMMTIELAEKSDFIRGYRTHVNTDGLRAAYTFRSLADRGRGLALLLRYETTLTRTCDHASRQLRELRASAPQPKNGAPASLA